jgi:hypothetical protein
MNAATGQHNWTYFLKFYNEQNKGRATRLGVFENENDYWLENGLPLVGISALVLRNWGHLAAYSLDPDGHVLAFASPDNAAT